MKRNRRIPARALSAVAVLVAISLGCSGESCNGVGKKAAKVVPVLEKVNPDYATSDLQCDEPIATGVAKNCSIKTLTCGDEVEGSTSSGSMNWGDDFYQKAFCTPNRYDYDEGPEASYKLHVPADVQADIHLESPCEDLDVIAVAWIYDKCPEFAHADAGRIRECEMDTDRGSGSVRVTTVNKAQTYLVVVDGKEGVSGNFRISVKCSSYR